MIHYHGTPIGGSRVDAARFLVGRHALIPFKRPDDLAPAIELCQSFVLDNSAFSYWRAGKGDVPVADYHEWVSSVAMHPSLDWVLIPDKIDGTEQDNIELVSAWMRLGCRAQSVPVWHLHESLEWLDYLVANFQRVALGSSGQWASPGSAGWWARMGEAMSVACDEQGRPRAKLHGLRMMNPKIFSRLPLSSADSTNAAVNSGSLNRFGLYVPTTAAQRAAVIAERIEQYSSASVWSEHPASRDAERPVVEEELYDPWFTAAT